MEERALLSIGAQYPPADEIATSLGNTVVSPITAVELASPEDVISLRYDLPELFVQPVAQTENGETLSQVAIPGTSQSFQEGRPVLPLLPLEIVVPYGRAVGTIDVIADGLVTLEGSYLLEEWSQPLAIDPLPGSDVNDLTEVVEGDAPADDAIFDSLYEFVGIQWRRGVEIARINLNPVQYSTETGEVSHYTTLTLKVNLIDADANASEDYQTIGYREDDIRALEADVANPGALETYIESLSTVELPSLGICNPSDSFQYVAITSQALASASTDYTIQDLIGHKQSQGMSSTVVTLESIYSAYSGVDQAEKIRNFIIDAYNNWETDFVLLGGDSNIVPYRNLQASISGLSSSETAIPSDLYYQCLNGNFNSDGDSYWGEPTDGPSGGDVDLAAEVYVGRVAANNEAEMANWVYKTIAYENTASSPYRFERHDGRRTSWVRRRFGVCQQFHGRNSPG